jgi:hypothetical protein
LSSLIVVSSILSASGCTVVVVVVVTEAVGDVSGDCSLSILVGGGSLYSLPEAMV